MKKEIKFEEALEKLEATVKKLESGNMSLDDSLVAFEEAVSLVKICNEKLENAEQRVRILTEGVDGLVSDAPFDVADET
jgi:exodeoxyribonuclease VII small subunit